MHNIMDTLPEDEYNYIVQLAANICKTPIALISFIDSDRQWFKAKVGVQAKDSSREISFCQYTIMRDETMLLEDSSKDERFKEHPYVKNDPKILFYAGSPIKDNQGLNLGTLCVIDYVPRSMDAEQLQMLSVLSSLVSNLLNLRLKKRELKTYQKFFKHSMDLLCVAGVDGYFKIINPAFSKLLGYSTAYLLSKSFLSFVHVDDRQKTLDEIAKLKDGHETIKFTNRYQKKDGSYVILDWNTEPDISTGELFAVAHDVTELVEKNQKLNEVIKYKDVFLSNMSHEIRTPMNAILGFSELLRKTKLNTEQQDFLKSISVASDTMMVIINDILDLAKMEAGKLEMDLQPFSIRKVVESILKMMAPRAVEKGLKLFLMVDSELPMYLLGDQARLTQILVNLINNAIKFTDAGKVEISIQLESHKDGMAAISFVVKDTGVGIPDEKIASIFERFEQINVHANQTHGGTGLGLSIVDMLVRLHQGKIKVKSKVGEGSEFKVEIKYPIGIEPSEIQMNDHDSKCHDFLKGKKILVAEDNVLNQKLVKKYVSKYGAEVMMAGDGLSCVETLLNDTYDAVLMDLQMPLCDGFEAAKIIRKKHQLQIPIIGCTALLMNDEKNKCIEAGMNAYIAKPYTENELLLVLKAVLFGKSDKHVLSMSKRKSILKTIEDLKEREGEVFFGEVMPIFVKSVEVELGALKNALSDEDYMVCGRIAHKLKGSLGILHLLEGSEMAEKVEMSIKNKEWEMLPGLAKKFIFEIEDILGVASEYLNTKS